MWDFHNDIRTRVANPDPSDPYVFGPTGSGSGSFSQIYGSGSSYHLAKIVLFTSFIRIHWYTVPPTFQFTVWEDGFDYIVFFQMGILNMIQHFMHIY